MNIIGRKVIYAVTAALVVCLAYGCSQQGTGKKSDDLASLEELGPTIGSLVRVTSPGVIKVEGYGLVSGLRGTGSADCPPRIRTYLTRYIRKQLPADGSLNVDEYISRPDTAAVFIEAMMPAADSQGDYFDVLVTALPGTQTTSLEGGWLFDAELRKAGSLGVATMVMADVKGPIYTDKVGGFEVNGRMGHIMAGGKVLGEHKIELTLLKPNYEISNAIRDRLNGRFGMNTARALTSGKIELTIPPKYKLQKQRFIAVAGAMFLTQDPAIDQERIAAFIKRLAGSQDKFASEVAIEAIGNMSLGKLGDLLNSTDELVRLHAARCMLNLGSDAGLTVLRESALNENSPYRLDALFAITTAAAHNDAIAIARLLLRDDKFVMRLAAYEQLRELEDLSVLQEQVAGVFYLERIAQTDKKVIYISRTGQPRVVLFGAPISCRGNIFFGSADGDITINAPAGAEYVTIIRKHPTRPGVVTQLRSSFEVGDIVRTLCDEPPKEDEGGRGGLGVSYADAAVLLKEMCDKGAVDAEFHAGPMPNFSLNIKK